MPLPEPSADALIASRALESLIRNDIRAHRDWISFARFMELALYAEGLGYYAGGSSKLGKDGDFTTAPEITPLFGATIGRFAIDCFGTEPLRILEFGAGTGRLALDVMQFLGEQGVAVVEYLIVELSADLRERQREMLAGFPQVQWLSVPPTAFSGLILCNEVLDAMPVQLLHRKNRTWYERGLVWETQGQELEVSAEPVSSANPASQQNLQALKWNDRVTDARPPIEIEGEHDYLTEIHLQAHAFIQTLADRLLASQRSTGKGGAVFLLDYGFPEHEYFHPQRHMGTLMCHQLHRADPDPLSDVGAKDITAHVDFTGIALAAQDAGLHVLGYTSQAHFLINCGLLEPLAEAPLEEKAMAQKLITEHEMGELFKVIALGTHAWEPLGFKQGDRSHTL